ncbi:MAG: hypothetical protein L3J09_05325 [Flavobacteriaceae bacterium]|nr:hypothetical protein [Flavobacteriaceae bacterium]
MKKIFNFKHIKGGLFGGVTAEIVALSLAFDVSSGLGLSVIRIDIILDLAPKHQLFTTFEESLN